MMILSGLRAFSIIVGITSLTQHALGKDGASSRMAYPVQSLKEVIGSTIRSNTQGDSLIYSALKGGKLVVVRDGKQDQRTDGIGRAYPIFSPDGQHIAYVATRGRKMHAVHDDDLALDTMRFLRSLQFNSDASVWPTLRQQTTDGSVVINGKRGRNSRERPIIL